jgi:hypothetical protein
MSLATTLKVTRTLGYGSAALCSSALILVVGLTYVACSVALSLATAAHTHAGYSPLLNGPTPTAPPAGHGPTAPSPVHTSAQRTPSPAPTPTDAPSPAPVPLAPAPVPSPQSSADPATPTVVGMSVTQLKALAKQRGVKGATRMRKAALVLALT